MVLHFLIHLLREMGFLRRTWRRFGTDALARSCSRVNAKRSGKFQFPNWARCTETLLIRSLRPISRAGPRFNNETDHGCSSATFQIVARRASVPMHRPLFKIRPRRAEPAISLADYPATTVAENQSRRDREPTTRKSFVRCHLWKSSPLRFDKALPDRSLAGGPWAASISPEAPPSL